MSLSVQILYWFLTARSVVEGETAALVCIQGSQRELLYMLEITASPCLLHSMSLAGFNFCLFIYIYVHVGVYVRIKTVPSFTANTTSGWT